MRMKTPIPIRARSLAALGLAGLAGCFGIEIDWEGMKHRQWDALGQGLRRAALAPDHGSARSGSLAIHRGEGRRRTVRWGRWEANPGRFDVEDSVPVGGVAGVPLLDGSRAELFPPSRLEDKNTHSYEVRLEDKSTHSYEVSFPIRAIGWRTPQDLFVAGRHPSTGEDVIQRYSLPPIGFDGVDRGEVIEREVLSGNYGGLRGVSFDPEGRFLWFITGGDTSLYRLDLAGEAAPQAAYGPSELPGMAQPVDLKSFEHAELGRVMVLFGLDSASDVSIAVVHEISREGRLESVTFIDQAEEWWTFLWMVVIAFLDLEYDESTLSSLVEPTAESRRNP